MELKYLEEVQKKTTIDTEKKHSLFKLMCIMKSDHSAVRLEFTNWPIKFKTTFIKKPVIDWKTIKEKDDVNKNFNINLRNRLQEPFNYTKFNESILLS